MEGQSASGEGDDVVIGCCPLVEDGFLARATAEEKYSYAALPCKFVDDLTHGFRWIDLALVGCEGCYAYPFFAIAARTGDGGEEVRIALS